MNREMKHSGIAWIGDIPNQWEVVRHKNVMHKQKDIQELYHKQDIISLTMGGVVVRDLNAGGKMPTSFDGYQHVYPNDLLLCLFDIDVTPRCVGLVKNAGVTSPAYSRFITHSNAYAPYYDYLLRYIDDYKCFLHLSKNLRSSLTETDFGMIHTCLPPLAEQKAIADFLDKKCEEIDELVALQEKIIEELKSYKQSVITETVCKGLNPNAPMKDSGVEWIGEIPEGWNLRYIKDVATFHNGDRGVNYPSGDDLVSDGIPFLTSNNLHQLLLDIEKYTCKYITLDRYNILGGVKIQLDDIIYCLRGSIGNCTLNKQITEGTVASSLMVIRPRYISPEYLNYYLHSHIVSAQTEVYMNGTCAANLSAENVSKFNIHIPPAEEQQEIADYLDKKCSEIEQLISIKQQKVVELKEYKKSLIYEYTTGKKEVAHA